MKPGVKAAQITAGTYLSGTQGLYRVAAGPKLIILAVALVVLAFYRTPAGVAAGLAVTLALAAWSRLPAVVLYAQVRPFRWVLLIIAAVQWWWWGPLKMVVIVGALLVAVLASSLVTITTRTPDLLDAVVAGLRPLRPIGVDPERVALVLALTVRSIPVIAGLAQQVHQARVARGRQRSVRAFAVPLTIRTLRHADQLGEALIARGVDD